MSTNPFATLLAQPDRSPLQLPASQHFSPCGHRWQDEELAALTAALAAQRPLLVRGEPGSGKSQLARAAAVVLGGAAATPWVEVIHPRFEAQDLKYRFDAVARLVDAQAGAQNKVKRVGDYVRPGSLWQAMAACRPGQPPAVLLIDEIDKADADLPNALLDVLGNRSLFNPLTRKVIEANEHRPMPLILITTNEERELPAAFVRRCLVLNLNPPPEPDAFQTWLIQRAQAHPSLQGLDEAVLQTAARKVWTDREAAQRLAQQTVGQAEYLDLLTALQDLTQSLHTASQRKKAQLEWLDKLARYFLVKGSGMPGAASSAA